MNHQKIDEQLTEMEEQLSHLIGAIEAIEEARKASQATSAALKKSQTSYTNSTKETIAALDEYGKALSEKGDALLSANEKLIKEVGNLNLDEVTESIKEVDGRVKEALQPQLEQSASGRDLKEASELLKDGIDTAINQMGGLAAQFEQLNAETKLVKVLAIAATCTGLLATILSAVGLFL